MSTPDDPIPDGQLARLSGMNLNLLVPLAALIEERSITRAAQRVGLTQPAMSHALRRIRRVLDDEILVREGAAMILTPRGRDLQEPLRAVLAQAARVMDRSPRFDPQRDARTVTIVLTTSTAALIGGALLALVSAQAPHLRVRLRTMTVPSPAVFVDDGVDVVLLPEVYGAPYPRERLFDDRWVVIVRADQPGVSALALLQDLPHIVFEAAPRRGSPYDVLDDHGIAYTVTHSVSDNLLVPALVAGSGGVGMHRASAIERLGPALGLRMLEFPFAVEGLAVDMVWNPRVKDAAFVGWLRGVLREAAGQSPAEPGAARVVGDG